MIDQIINLKNKSFKNYTTPENFFKKKNILFGYNGRGKSTLALGIIDTYRQSGSIEDNFRFFNRDYVKETFLLADEVSAIKGVKVTFSENDAEITKKIKELEKQKIDIIVSVDEIEKRKKRLREEIDYLHNLNKGRAKIKKKNSNLSIEEVLDLYKSDFEKAYKIVKSNSFLRSFISDTETLLLIKDNAVTTNIPQFNIKKLSEKEVEFINKTLQRHYKDLYDIPPTEVLQWLEKGIYLHTGTETHCMFCKNPFNIKEVKKRIKEYLENEKQKDINRLEDIKNIIESNLSIIEHNLKFKNNLKSIELNPDILDNIENNVIIEMRKLINNINDKIKDMSCIYDSSDCISIFESEVDKVSSKISNAYNLKIKRINDSISHLEILAKGKIALSILDNNLPKMLEEIKKDEEYIEAIKNSNKVIDEKIRELKDKQSEYIDFMNFLNDILKSLGIQIKLTLHENNYYLQHNIEGCALKVDDISEGEKNLLSLLYFYFELYNDNQQEKFKENIDLIVVDDPISSLDDANKFYVLELIKKLLIEKKPQIFVFTHSWDDFCQITYRMKNNSTVGLFEIYKNPMKNFQSEIRLCPTNLSPYNKLFLELYELSKKDYCSLNKCDIYHAANSMRRVFEEFLNFKKPNLLPQKNNQKEIEDIYEKATGHQMGNNRKRKLGSFLSFINVLSHRSIRSEEILENSKFILQLIKDIDKIHYESMKVTK